jgi:tRNA threonylcarbamoyladenosine biosynthesis protein TsaB
MLTLAVDTTAEFGSIALAEDFEVLEEVLLHEEHGFSAILFGQMEALLERRGVRLNEIGLFAGASGPGSFTGVRVGLSAIKGLAEVLSKPAVAVSNLVALAEFGTANARAAVIDARRGEIFGAVFDGNGKEIVEETVIPFPRFLERLNGFLERLKDLEIEWICADFAPFQAALAGTRFETTPVVTAPRALAGAMAQIALRQLRAGGLCEAAAIEANYVRRSDAELLWKSL